MDNLFGAFAKMIEKHPGKHLSLTDSTAMRTMPDAKGRRHIADAQARHDAKYGARNLGAVIIIDSPLVRGALTAVNWIQPLKSRQDYVGTRLVGLRTCIQWMEAEGMVPEAVRAYLSALERDPRAPFP